MVESIEEYYKSISVLPGEAKIIPELENPNFLGKIRRNIFRWMTINNFLFLLRASYRECFGLRIKGIDEDQLSFYLLFTKYMTTDEKYNPQRMTYDRVDQLSKLSKIDSYVITSLIYLFYKRYRSNKRISRRLEDFILESLDSSDPFIRKKFKDIEEKCKICESYLIEQHSGTPEESSWMECPNECGD